MILQIQVMTITTQLPWVGVFYASNCETYYASHHCCFCMIAPHPLGGSGAPDGVFGIRGLTCCRWSCGTNCYQKFPIMMYCLGQPAGTFACSSHCRCGTNLSGGYTMSPYGVARCSPLTVYHFLLHVMITIIQTILKLTQQVGGPNHIMF